MTNLVFVTPAYRRFAVTRLAFAQRAHLIGELAERGIIATQVVIADDENLEIASEHGFDTIGMDNSQLGRRVNDGFERAAEQGADWFCFVGSDNWLHPALFESLPVGSAAPVVAGRSIAIVDLLSPRLRVLRVGSRHGAPPWLIPRWALEPSRFRPMVDRRMRALELSLTLGLGVTPEWVFRDPSDVCRVDFKSGVNITTWDGLAHLGRRDETDPWGVLVGHYPSWLVALAEQTSELLAAPVAA